MTKAFSFALKRENLYSAIKANNEIVFSCLQFYAAVQRVEFLG